MSRDKVSEKAIWEDSITPDSNPSPIVSQTQPQMMLCYKCNNPIPNDSNYCPYCQVKLYTECPKCGVKYSSQYPFCNQCGTNREEYLRLQREEQERRDAIERENKRRQEILEREKQERVRQEELRIAEEKAKEEQAKAEFEAENRAIMETEEYKSTYSLLTEAQNRSYKAGLVFSITCASSPFIVAGVLILWQFLVQISIALCIGFVLIVIITFCRVIYLSYFRGSTIKYVLEKNVYYNKEEVSDIINSLSIMTEEKACIIAYRKKHGLPISYK